MSGHNIFKSSVKIYQLTEFQNGKNITIRQKIRVHNYNTVCIFIQVKTSIRDSVYLCNHLDEKNIGWSI